MDGDGRELRHLHDVVNQHLQALRSMDFEPSGPFITSMLELKLDANTMFEWQKFSQDLLAHVVTCLSKAVGMSWQKLHAQSSCS